MKVSTPWTTVGRAAGLVLGRDYPEPVVDHATARALTLQRYGMVKKVEIVDQP